MFFSACYWLEGTRKLKDFAILSAIEASKEKFLQDGDPSNTFDDIVGCLIL